MNSFERFQITHLSPSALNLWVGAPGLWALKYIAKIKDGGSPAMWRGTAVENGLTALLHGRSIQEACDAAHQSFDMNCKSNAVDQLQAEDEGGLITSMIEQCAEMASAVLVAQRYTCKSKSNTGLNTFRFH